MEEINKLITEKEFAQAKNELQKIYEKYSQNYEALKLLGLCHINLDEYNEGKVVFETVVKYLPEDASSWFYLANCYDNLEDYLHAKTAYLEVIRLRKEYIEAYKNLCIVYVKSNEGEKAIELGKQAIELAQDDYSVYYIVGTACMSLKKFDESVYYLEKAIELEPDFIHAKALKKLIHTKYLKS